MAEVLTPSKPEIGMVANCDWPGDPKPERRPVLIMDVEFANNQWQVVAIYGTGQTNINTRLESWELRAMPADHPELGLSLPTVFKFNDNGVLLLPWTEARFGRDVYNNPTLRGRANAPFMSLARTFYKAWNDNKARRVADKLEEEARLARNAKLIQKANEEAAWKKKKKAWREAGQSKAPLPPTDPSE